MSAFDEEGVVHDCLESVKDWAAEIVVVDGSSRDRTGAIAGKYTNRVLTTTNKLMLNVNKNVAIDAATCEWVLLLDPDERVSAELARRLRAIAGARASPFVGYWILRRNFELGRWMPWPDWQLRFFRNGSARFPCRHIHEMLAVEGPVARLAADLIHTPRQRLSDHVHKRNLESEHGAAFLYERGVRFRLYKLLLYPFRSFLEQYLLRGRWRGGIPGLINGVNQGYGTFLQHAKLWQMWEEARRVHHADPVETFFSGLSGPPADRVHRSGALPQGGNHGPVPARRPQASDEDIPGSS